MTKRRRKYPAPSDPDYERRMQRIDLTQNFIEAVRVFDRPVRWAKDCATEFDPDYAEYMGEEITAERMRKVAAFVAALAKEWIDPVE